MYNYMVLVASYSSIQVALVRKMSVLLLAFACISQLLVSFATPDGHLTFNEQWLKASVMVPTLDFPFGIYIYIYSNMAVENHHVK